MEVTLTDLTANHKKISVSISKEEFLQERKKSIKKYQKSAIVPGFRPGTVPESLILKMYGNGLGIDEIYEKAFNSFQEEISKNQIKQILDPIAEFHADSDFTTGENIKIEFEIGVEPEFSIDVSDITHETLYIVELTDQELEEEISRLISENKNVVPAEDASEVQAFEIVLQTNDQEHQNEVIFIDKNDIAENRFNEFADLFKEKKQDLNIFEYLQNPDDEKFEKLKNLPSLTLGRMVRFEDITIDALPEKIFPGRSFENIDEFKSLLKSQIEQKFNSYTENLYIEKTISNLLQRVPNLPVEFISKWWKSKEKEKNSESFEEIKPYIINELSMNLIHKKLADILEIKITRDQVVEYFLKYYSKSIPENQHEVMVPIIQNFIEKELSDNEKSRKMFEKTYEETLRSKLLSLKTIPVKITFSEFKELLSNKTL